MMNEPTTIRELICGYPEPTAKDITIVSDSLSPLTKEQLDGALAQFYQRLFTRQPSLMQLFKSFRSVDQPDQQAMRLQRNKLAEIIALGLKLWEKPQQLIPALENLGHQHHQYGVRDEYYEDVWIALSEVLSEAFGQDKWEDICESWQRFIFLCARHMLNGTKDLPEPDVVEGYPLSVLI
jgi:hemoglobin-like flavoprotein